MSDEKKLSERVRAYEFYYHDDIVVTLADEIAALEKRLVEAGWQPIETAPKDGQRVLLGQRGFVTKGYRDHDGSHVCSVIGRPLYPFTHWMPLPPPPQENAHD